MVESYGKNSKTKSLRQQVFALLDENPYFTAKILCKKLGLSYEQYSSYLGKLKSEWKSYCQNEPGSKCLSVHGWSGWCFVPLYVDREVALEVGWEATKSKNRWLLWRDRIGRMMWFETGNVNLYVRSPVNLGKVKQLVCNGFSFTGLISDNRVMFEVLETIKPFGAHYVFETGHRLPRKTIRYFEKSHGLTIKIGDKSHPRAVEVESVIPDWAQKLSFSLDRIAEIFGADANEKEHSRKNDYVV